MTTQYKSSTKTFMGKIALQYLKLGWSIFPLPSPLDPNNKKPLVKWRQFQNRLPTKAEVTQWWTNFPDANIGVATGKLSKIVVIDFDSPIAIEQFKYLVSDRVLNTIVSKTVRGYHAFFKWNDEHPIYNSVGIIDKVDIRGEGGFIVLPPTIRTDGSYRWLNIDPTRDGLEELSEIPEEIINYIKNKKESSRSTTINETGWLDEALQGKEEGERNTTATKLAGYFLRLNGMTLKSTISFLNNWDQLNKPPLGKKEIEKCVKSVYERYVKPEQEAKKTEIKKAAEAYKTKIKEVKSEVKKEVKKKASEIKETAKKIKEQEAMQEAIQEGLEMLKQYIAKITILQYPDSDDQYQFTTNEGRSITMLARDISSSRIFFSKLLKIIHRVFPPIKEKIWAEIMSILLENAEIKTIHEEETILSKIKEILHKKTVEFLKNYDESADNIDYALERFCYVRDEKIYTTIESVMKWSEYDNELKNISRKDMAKLLRNIGAKIERTRIKGARKYFWVYNLNNLNLTNDEKALLFENDGKDEKKYDENPF